MRVEIEIPDVVWNMVMNTGTYGPYRFSSTNAIRNGTPLSEGHWIKIQKTQKGCHDTTVITYEYHCSECDSINVSPYKNFCPNCGCRMVEPQESEEV